MRTFLVSSCDEVLMQFYRDDELYFLLLTDTSCVLITHDIILQYNMNIRLGYEPSYGFIRDIQLCGEF